MKAEPDLALAELGAVLRAKREARKLSRSALARRAKVSESTIKNIEKCQHRPTIATLAALESVLGDLRQSLLSRVQESRSVSALGELLRLYSPEAIRGALEEAGIDLGALQLQRVRSDHT